MDQNLSRSECRWNVIRDLDGCCADAICSRFSWCISWCMRSGSRLIESQQLEDEDQGEGEGEGAGEKLKRARSERE